MTDRIDILQRILNLRELASSNASESEAMNAMKIADKMMTSYRIEEADLPNEAYEEAARDLGASGRQTVQHVVLPIVLPSLIGVALFGFTLSYDELARTSQSGGALNTLPLELLAMQTNATTPVIYALGTLTTALSITVIAVCLATVVVIQRRRARLGSDAGKGMV